MKWWRALMGRLRWSPAPGAEGSAEDAPTITVAKQRLESRVLAMPSVVSVGVGSADDGTEVIVVGVDGSRPDLEFPKTADGFPVEVRRIGPLRAT